MEIQYDEYYIAEAEKPRTSRKLIINMSQSRVVNVLEGYPIP